MSTAVRADWARHVEQVIRSRHYTWIGEGLGGENVDDAMASITADILHICLRQGLSWQRILERGRAQFEAEERAAPRPESRSA